MSPFNIVQAMTYEVFERPVRSLRHSDGLFTEARWAEMKRRGDVKKKESGQDEKLGGLGFPCHSASSANMSEKTTHA